jgi:hypothetical protein
VDINIAQRVVTEPGDATRYDLIVYRDGPDEFTFAPARSTFRVPQRLNYWDIREADHDEIVKISLEYQCNYHTVKECIRIALILHEGGEI